MFLCDAELLIINAFEKLENVPVTRTAPLNTRRMFLVVALFVIESFLRLTFFYVGTYGGSQLITPPPSAYVMNFINVFSLALGLAGLLAIPGLVFYRKWGYWGLITVSLLTIVFDLWAFSKVAQTAIAGLIVPVIVLAYFLPKYRRFLDQKLNGYR